MVSRPAIAVACGIVAVVTLLVGVYGWLTESAAVLLLTATPMFAVLALSFGLSARQRGPHDGARQ